MDEEGTPVGEADHDGVRDGVGGCVLPASVVLRVRDPGQPVGEHGPVQPGAAVLLVRCKSE